MFSHRLDASTYAYVGYSSMEDDAYTHTWLDCLEVCKDVFLSSIWLDPPSKHHQSLIKTCRTKQAWTSLRSCKEQHSKEVGYSSENMQGHMDCKEFKSELKNMWCHCSIKEYKQIFNLLL
jgi:hypothetical protein